MRSQTWTQAKPTLGTHAHAILVAPRCDVRLPPRQAVGWDRIMAIMPARWRQTEARLACDARARPVVGLNPPMPTPVSYHPLASPCRARRRKHQSARGACAVTVVPCF